MDKYNYIGIGASAGGLQVFEKLVSLLPLDKEYVYILAQHLDPTKESILAQILSRHTALQVHTITKSTHFQAKNIYVIPAGFDLVLKENSVSLQKSKKNAQHIPTPSIDTLFTSLALYKKDKAIAILLTGTGHDGSEGIKNIKENGGITIAQNPEEATYGAMPQNAISTDNVDYIFNIKEIIQTLSSTTEIQDSASLVQIKSLLKKYKNFNIQEYKQETIIRRIHKRMLLIHLTTLQEYAAYMQKNREEITFLYQDILIGVTSFFRDKDSFDVLKNELYLYLQDKPEHYEFKVWSIACSTGEEAYTLAIIIDQVSQELHKEFSIKIFASDVDALSIQKAREAIYTAKDLQNVDKKILQEYFVAVNDSFQIISSLRKNIVFTIHNILSDPPFMNHDLISCRNFLIYIKPEMQQEIFALLHYGLKENGLLFLGSSESTLLSVNYFSALNTEHKIYIKEKLKNPPRISHHYFSKHLSDKLQSETQSKTVSKVSTNFDIQKGLQETIVDYLMPNSVVIDTESNIIYKKGSLSYVTMPDGFISLNLIANLHSSLQYSVQRVIASVLEDKQHHSTKFIEVNLEHSSLYVKVLAYIYQKPDSPLLILLYFQELQHDELQFDMQNLNLPNESAIIKSLSSQLKQAQTHTHILEDKLIVNKENMQLLNEELQSANEELQSSNEELETSNEELQSSNEELHASVLNEQNLQEKLSGILNATQDGIIGLDLHGKHIFVNDAMQNLLGFSKEEFMSNNAHKLWHHTKADGSLYLEEECPIHTHLNISKHYQYDDLIWKKDGTALEVKIVQNPLYKDSKVVGSVLSITDMSEKNRLKKEALHEHNLTELYLNTIGTLVMTLDIDGNISMINKEGAILLASSQAKLIGKNWFENFLPKESYKQVKEVFQKVLHGDIENTRNYTNTIIDSKKQEHIMFWTNHFLHNESGENIGIISSGIDITKEQEASKKLFEQEHLYKLTFDRANIGIAHVSLDGRWMEVNAYLRELLGYTKKEFHKLSVADVTFAEDRDTDKTMQEELIHKQKESYQLEKRYIHKNGTIIWVSLSVILLRDEEGKALFWVKIIRDISELKLLLYTLEAEKNKFQKILDFTPTPVLLYKESGEILLLNKKYQEMTGLTLKKNYTIDMLIDTLYAHNDLASLNTIRQYYKNPTEHEDVKHTLNTLLGETRTGIFNAVALENIQESKSTLYLIAITDITELLKKDDLMLAQSRQAAMGEMLAMIAHQWRQPLSVISMLANNIKLKIELDEEITQDDTNHLVSTLNKQTQYLSQTIEDFRDFFKPEKIKESVSVDVVIKKIETLVGSSLKNNAITLKLPSKNSTKISVYRNQLIQVMLNLINNAKDAIISNTSMGGKITLDVVKEHKNILISVCDNGGGIDPKVITKIGEPYVSTKTKNGTGLGLYMSKTVVEKNLDGKLYWKSDTNGSCFYISLPVQ